MRTRLCALGVAPLLLVLTACDEINFGGSERFKEDFHYSYPLPAGGKLYVDNYNGSIEISGWDKSTVDISGTKYANTEDRLSRLKIDVSASSDSVRVQTVPPTDHFGNMGARYVIHVPKKVVLDRIISSNGSIRVEDVEGRATLRTSNGSIHIDRLTGDVEARTSNGSVEANGVSGDSNFHTSNGTIRADVTKGAFDASTTNGSITARLREPDASHAVRLESSNGRIELTMDAAREVRASTSNSSIIVRLPDSINADVRARTSNSSINSAFDVTTRGGERSKHRLEGTIGKGGPLLDLSTSNGSIKIERM